MALPAIVTANDFDPATLSIVAGKVVAQDPTKAPATITGTSAPSAPIAAGDTVDVAVHKLQSQISTIQGGLVLKQTIGTGSTKTFTINHGFNTFDISVQVFELATGLTDSPGVLRIDANNVRIDFAANIPLNSYRVLIQAL